jgi:hypothetical protein
MLSASPAKELLVRRFIITAAATLGALALSSVAAASITRSHSSGTIDVGGDVLTCPLEHIVFSGRASFVESSTFKELSTGDQTTATFLFNLRGVTATGETTGTEYRVVGVTSTGFSFSFAGLATASVSRFVQTWLLLPSGAGAPLSFHEVLSATFNASGQLVAFVVQGPTDCD